MHRAESIMAALTTAITGLATTRGHIERERPYRIGNDVNYALSVYQGEETPSDESPWPRLYVDLEVYIDIYAKISSVTPVSTKINLIREEVTIALDPDNQNPLGLEYIHWLKEGTTFEVERDYGEKPLSQTRMTWRIRYERSISNPGT